MTANRKDGRAALAALLETNLTLAQAVYAYKVGDLQGASPVVIVLSSGTNRPRLTMRGNRSAFNLEIHTYTIDAVTAEGWTEADVEDSLDNLENEIAAVLAANPVTDNWQAIDYADASRIREVIIGGQAYIEEIIPVTITVFS